MRRNLAIAGAAIALTALTAAPSALGDSHQPSFHQINLVSNEPGKAQIMDPNLVNPWGMSHGPNTPLWVSDNGRDVTTLYTASAGGTSVAAVPLVVGIPGGGAPTGQAFNDTSGFVVPGTTDPALFVFAGEDGDVSAWNLSVTPLTEAVPVGHVDGAVFKGLALVHSPFGPLLLLTDFHNNQVDVFDSTFQRLPAAGLFRDPGLPAGYAPFNVAQIGDQVFVTYAVQDANREDDVAGPAHGIIDAYTTSGAFVRRFVSHSVLNSPWALLVAPETFGRFAGDLLVGNFGDGRIHAFDLRTGALKGTLLDANHHAIQIDGLWGLIRGDEAAGGPNSVWFSAGPDDEANGLLGLLQPN